MSREMCSRELAHILRQCALLDTIDNMTALLLLVASAAIERQADRLVRQAAILERLEAQHDAQ